MKKNFLLAAILMGGTMLMTPSVHAASSTAVEVDPETGASVEVEQHRGILPRNRGTDVHVEAPPPEASAPPPPDEGAVVEKHEETIIHHD
jgi:hypothetical protein